MSEQDGAPDVEPGDGRVVGDDRTGASAPDASDAPSPDAPPVDATGPIERSQGSNRVFAGRYRLLARRGTATDVALFEAVDADTGRTVAVKIVHPDICARPDFGARFHETMAKVAALRHPHLTEVIDVGTATWSGREVQYVICENLTAGSLRDLRDRGRQLSPSQTVMIGLDACRGLDVAHRAGLVHGDIRPNSLVFGVDGRLRIADLGLASLVNDAWWDDPAGVNIDKAKYASPEQARGERPGAKSDVYSLDLCLLEAVTGQLPFVADSSVSTLANRVDRLLPVSADLGPLAAVLERAGRPDADDRSSAAEFGRALHQAAERLPRPAPLALLGGAVGAVAPAAPAAAEPTTPEPAPAVPEPAAASSGDTVDASEASASAAPDLPEPTATVADDAAPESSDVSTSVAASVGAIDPVEAVDSRDAAESAESVDATAEVDAIEPVETGERVAGAVDVDARTIAADDAATIPRPTLPPARPALPVTPPVTEETAASATTSIGVRDVLRPPAGAEDADGHPEIDGTAATGLTAGTNGADGADGADAVEPPVAKRRRRWPLLLVLLLLLGAIGAGAAWWFNRTISHEVPALVGLEQGEALNMISEFDWEVVTTEAADDEVPAGVVIRTDPAAGTSLAEGSPFSLVVSTGPAPRVLPELAGLTVNAATTALEELDLVLEVGDEPFDEEVPPGEIISWTVPDQPALVAGDTVLPGTAVVISVSAGPAPRVVPDLATLTVDQATAQLTELGLVVVVLPEEFSDTVPVGAIARQDPPAGTELERGATVSVAVSKGQDLVAVPPLADLGVDQVRAALEAAGLVLGEVRGDPAGVTVQADVGAQTIGAGAVFPRGTVVDVTFQVPAPPPTEVPAEVPVEGAPAEVPPA